jgi:hypothetical protein
MIRNITPLFLCLLIFSCRGKFQQAKVQNKDTALKMLIWGLPLRDQETAIELAAKNYGFEYRRIGGCVITKNVYDSALKVNEKSDKILQARFGNDWKIEIEKKMHAIRDSISQARSGNDLSKAEVIGVDEKPAKKKVVIKIVKDCCTAEDSCEPKPPLLNKDRRSRIKTNHTQAMRGARV